jgi:hypothetical protein
MAPPIVPRPIGPPSSGPQSIGDQRLDLGERRAGAGAQHQLLRLVQRDTREAGQMERQVGLDRPPDPALRALAEDLERLALTQRPLHGLLDVLGIARFERIGHDGH